MSKTLLLRRLATLGSTNFYRILGYIEMKPAMAAGDIDKLGSMNELYNAVVGRAERKRKDARLETLITRLRMSSDMR